MGVDEHLYNLNYSLICTNRFFAFMSQFYVNDNNNNNNSLFDPIMKNTIRNTILENKLRYGHPKKPSGLV